MKPTTPILFTPTQLTRTEWSTDCTPTPRTLELIKQDISDQVAGLGFVHFSYEGAPYRMQHDLKAPKANRLFTLQHLARCKTALFSDARLAGTYENFFTTLAQHCPNFKRTTQFRQPFVHFSLQSLTAETRELWRKEGIRSRMTWPFKEFTSEHWGGIFTLLSTMSPAQLDEHLKEISQKLYHTLLMFHLELLANHRPYFNPYLSMGVFSNNALRAVQLTAEGKSSKEISEYLDISERGVDYHIDQMRLKLGARNRLHLIHIANKIEII